MSHVIKFLQSWNLPNKPTRQKPSQQQDNLKEPNSTPRSHKKQTANKFTRKNYFVRMQKRRKFTLQSLYTYKKCTYRWVIEKSKTKLNYHIPQRFISPYCFDKKSPPATQPEQDIFHRNVEKIPASDQTKTTKVRHQYLQKYRVQSVQSQFK
jgi:hypothetical protein